MSDRGKIVAKGPSIGVYRDRDIPAWVIGGDGRYAFDRPWDEESSDLSQLAADEIVIAPGLIYKLGPEAR